MTGAGWTRRTVLGVGLGAVGALVLPGTAGATEVTVGALSFTVGPEIGPVPADDVYGRSWQWLGRDLGAPRPGTVVLARADLMSTDAEEILGLLLAGSVAASPAGLLAGERRGRSMPGGGEQTRVNVQYTAARQLTYHGTLLIATRPEPPAVVLVVVGDERLTAGVIDGVLDSARWRS